MPQGCTISPRVSQNAPICSPRKTRTRASSEAWAKGSSKTPIGQQTNRDSPLNEPWKEKIRCEYILPYMMSFWSVCSLAAQRSPSNRGTVWGIAPRWWRTFGKRARIGFSACGFLRLSPKSDHFINRWFELSVFDLYAREFRALEERYLVVPWEKSTIFPVNDSNNLKRLGIDQYIMLW